MEMRKKLKSLVKLYQDFVIIFVLSFWLLGGVDSPLYRLRPQTFLNASEECN